MERTERFADVVASQPLPLDVAAFLIAAHASAGCDVDAGLRVLDDIAADVRDPSLAGVIDTVFGRYGFTGDRETYYDPQNSLLNAVIARRCGIPITLSVLLIEVARRVGVDLAGVGTPAHFLVRTVEGEPGFVDAFAGGRIYDRADLDHLFSQIAPGIDINPFLAPLPPVDVIRRMLNNLVAVYRKLGDRNGLLWSSELRIMLPGSQPEHVRAFGAALAAAGDFARAAKVIDALAEGGATDDPGQERAEASRLRARLN